MGRKSRRSSDEASDFGDSAYGDAWHAEHTGAMDGASAAWDAQGDYGDADDSRVVPNSRALAARDGRSGLPAERDALHAAPTVPLIISGTGVPMGQAMVRRRERPLLMRMVIISIMVCMLLSGLFTITPLGGSEPQSVSPFQALAGSVVWSPDLAYHWYTTQPGDEIETIANKFGVQVGGIYKLNNLAAGQDLALGVRYKIPYDSNYGADYVPPQPPRPKSDGTTAFGSNWWNSIAGAPPAEYGCAPDGGGNPMGYQLHPPNPGSYWVRGFSWTHNGVDLANPQGHPILAAQEGEVIWAGYDGTNGLGWSVVINHCYGISTIYGHMAAKPLVRDGDQVHPGDQVGIEGMTGWATGPHLHFMVQVNNSAVDPMAFFNWDIGAITQRDPSHVASTGVNTAYMPGTLQDKLPELTWNMVYLDDKNRPYTLKRSVQQTSDGRLVTTYQRAPYTPNLGCNCPLCRAAAASAAGSALA